MKLKANAEVQTAIYCVNFPGMSTLIPMKIYPEMQVMIQSCHCQIFRIFKIDGFSRKLKAMFFRTAHFYLLA